MTQKDLLAIAADENMMLIMKEIAEIQSNMCYKTIYEQKTAKAEMKRLAKEIIEELNK